MSPADQEQRLQTMLDQLRAEHPPAEPRADRGPPEGGALMHEFLRSFLVWEASVAQGEATLPGLLASVVDANELRVCLVDEIAAFFGPGYPLARERAQRLRAALNDLYRREHAVTFDTVEKLPKREAKSYLCSLEGVPPFVGARTSLLGTGAHAFPVDERIRALLLEREIIAETQDCEAAASWMERHIRSGEARQAYLLVEAALETRAGGGPPEPQATRPAPEPTPTPAPAPQSIQPS